MVIYKYKIDMVKMEFEWPKNSVVLHAGEQNGESFMWVQHDTAPEVAENKIKRTFLVKATGELFKPAGLTHVKTWQIGQFVFHLYEITVRRNDALR